MSATSFFGGEFFGGEFFQASAPPTPSSITSGGGGGVGYFRTKKGKRLFNQFFDDIVDEMRREKAMEAARAEIAKMSAKKGKKAKAELDLAIERLREMQRKRRLRKAAAILLLDN